MRHLGFTLSNIERRIRDLEKRIDRLERYFDTIQQRWKIHSESSKGTGSPEGADTVLREPDTNLQIPVKSP